MLKKILVLLFVFQLFLISAQEHKIAAKELYSVTIAMDMFVGFDEIGNYYYIKNNVFYKKNDAELWQYKNVTLSKITRVDIQNHLKILLFYDNFNTIILLDNQLNETQKINFSENTKPIVVSATGIASQNRLWIYNSLTQEIGLFDFLKNSFKTITPPLRGNLKHYESDFNTFRWIDDKMNWYSCDVFGKITPKGKVADFEQIQFISNQEVVFSKNGKLFLQDLNKDTIYTIENVNKSFNNFYYKDQILSIFTKQEITIFKIPIP